MAEPSAPARIRVSGFRVPRGASRSHRRKGVALVRPLNLAWVEIVAGVGATLAIGGSPHLLLASTSARYGAVLDYADCAYLGLDGRIIHTGGASCPWLRLLKPNR